MNIFLVHTKEWEDNGELGGGSLAAYSTKEAAMDALVKEVRIFNPDVFNDPKSNYFGLSTDEFEKAANREFLVEDDEDEDDEDEDGYEFYFGWRKGNRTFDYEITELMVDPSEN